MIDFTGLTDDQLVTLIQAACAEAVNRGTAVEAAARSAMLSEAEKAQIAAQAAQAEAERIRKAEEESIAREAAEQVRREASRQQIADKQANESKRWAQLKGVAMQMQELFNRVKLEVHVWEKAGDVRVYIQVEGDFDKKRAVYYATGNSSKAPGKLETTSSDATRSLKDFRPEIKTLCEKLAKNPGLKFTTSEALKWDGEPVLMEGYEELRAKRAAFNRDFDSTHPGGYAINRIYQVGNQFYAAVDLNKREEDIYLMSAEGEAIQYHKKFAEVRTVSFKLGPYKTLHNYEVDYSDRVALLSLLNSTAQEATNA